MRMKMKMKTRMRVAEAGEDDVGRRLESEVLRWMALALRAQVATRTGRFAVRQNCNTRESKEKNHGQQLALSLSLNLTLSLVQFMRSLSASAWLLIRLGLSSEPVRMAIAERNHARSSQRCTFPSSLTRVQSHQDGADEMHGRDEVCRSRPLGLETVIAGEERIGGMGGRCSLLLSA